MFFESFLTKFNKFIRLSLNKKTRRGLYLNIAASLELECLIKNLELNTIIDVGSNKGQFILISDKFFFQNFYSKRLDLTLLKTNLLRT